MTRLTVVITLLIGLSVAAERMVEIVKGFVPVLDQPKTEPRAEARRKAVLHILGVFAGILTTFIAGPMIPSDVYNATTPIGIIALGLLASGGSGFWNSMLSYASSIKDVKKAEAASAKEALGTSPGAHRDLDLGEEQVTSNECFDVEGA